jgi:hypothetical protein
VVCEKCRSEAGINLSDINQVHTFAGVNGLIFHIASCVHDGGEGKMQVIIFVELSRNHQNDRRNSVCCHSNFGLIYTYPCP